MERTFFISGNTPSSKNSKIWTGTFLVPSKTVSKWLRASRKEWREQAEKFLNAIKDLEKPYYIELTFIRKTRRKFDYINIAQVIFDEMQHHGWLEQDDADHVKPYFGDYQYDKHNPGVVIKVLTEKPKHYDNQAHTGTDQ